MSVDAPRPAAPREPAVIARVLGVAVAASSVSVGVITRRVSGQCIATVASFASRLPRDERVADLVGVVDHAAGDATLVVIGPAGEDLRHAITAALTARGIPLHHAQDKRTTAAQSWPEIKPANAGETTALALAHFGAVRLGWGVPTPVTEEAS